MTLASSLPRQSDTFPDGLLDLERDGGRRRRIGTYSLDPARLAHFNAVLHRISPAAPGLNVDQVASAGRRLLTQHAEDRTRSAFVDSRLALLDRLQQLVRDPAWETRQDVRECVAALLAYRRDPEQLLPASLPLIGELDDAMLVDVALQHIREELADYEDFCRFREVAAAFAGVPESDVGLTRDHWLDAMLHAQLHGAALGHRPQVRYAPDPCTSLFHIA